MQDARAGKWRSLARYKARSRQIQRKSSPREDGQRRKKDNMRLVGLLECVRLVLELGEPKISQGENKLREG
jgi:hypothetical protein